MLAALWLSPAAGACIAHPCEASGCRRFGNPADFGVASRAPWLCVSCLAAGLLLTVGTSARFARGCPEAGSSFPARLQVRQGRGRPSIRARFKSPPLGLLGAIAL